MVTMPTEREIQRIRSAYPPGTRIKLIEMDDPYTHLKKGDRGKVMHVDDMGQIHMYWDCGSTLALIPGVDKFSVEMEG